MQPVWRSALRWFCARCRGRCAAAWLSYRGRNRRPCVVAACSWGVLKVSAVLWEGTPWNTAVLLMPARCRLLPADPMRPLLSGRECSPLVKDEWPPNVREKDGHNLIWSRRRALEMTAHAFELMRSMLGAIRNALSIRYFLSSSCRASNRTSGSPASRRRCG